MVNRREFIGAASLAIGSSVFSGGISADSFLQAPSSNGLRQLALTAVDAALAAGASYADVRVGERQTLNVDLGNSLAPSAQISSVVMFGIRVIADGAWSFVHGTLPTVSSVSQAAREAVLTARSYSYGAKPFDMGTPSVVTGTWEIPYKIDPFTVPLEDQAALLNMYRMAAKKVLHGSDSGASFRWVRETRTFASSDGSCMTQIFRRSYPSLEVSGNLGMGDDGFGNVHLNVPRFGAASGGYESVDIPELPEEIKKLTEEAVRLAGFRRRTLDVGRYPVVFDGASFSKAFMQTIGTAGELDRALSYESDADGTSYMSPPNEVLGTQVTSPLISATANRSLPSIVAAKWDDEGVETIEYPFIDKGNLVNYHTSRETATSLRRSLSGGMNTKAHGFSNGCAVALDAGSPVTVQAPHLYIHPGNQATHIDDLCGSIKKGILILNAFRFSTDQQLASAYLRSGQLLEISNGKIVGRLDGNSIQFGATKFWKSLAGLGGESTLSQGYPILQKGQPWRTSIGSAAAPAGLFKEVDVVLAKGRR